MRKEQSETNGTRTAGYPYAKEWTDLCIIPQTKINSKRINDLKVRAETIKLLEENIWVNLHNLRFGNGFLDTTLKPQQKTKNIMSWTRSKFKTSVHQRTLSRKWKNNPHNRRKLLQIKGLLSRILKNSYNSTTKWQTTFLSEQRT